MWRKETASIAFRFIDLNVLAYVRLIQKCNSQERFVLQKVCKYWMSIRHPPLVPNIDGGVLH